MPPPPVSVAVIYNATIPESKQLAETYAQARAIPASNLIGLGLSAEEEISREDYDRTLRGPLAAEFDRRRFWTRSPDAKGNLAMTQTTIRIIVCMRGVPSRIRRQGDGEPKPGEQPYVRANEAAVDSELATIGSDGLPINGFVNNPYFKSTKSFSQAGLPIFLVGRIDGHSWQVCRRMIADAIATEKTGLWGMATIDLSKKYPQGDEWLEDIIRQNVKTGIPTLVDRFTDTLPVNYPLRDQAIYYGWYDWNVSGPFLKEGFRFRRGAVAVHLHSFSAAQLRDPQKNWSAPLLDRGAAATLGNVYEPYLQLTHHFDIFHASLLKGDTLVEAAYKAIPILSWQGIVLGDPLYRPFLHLEGSGEKADNDREYRALRLAASRWGNDPKQLEEKLHEAAKSLGSGIISEGLGLHFAAQGMDSLAALEFITARNNYRSQADLLRLDLHKVTIDRNAGKTQEAVKSLREMKARYSGIQEVAAVTAWLNILDPPAPPPANSSR